MTNKEKIKILKGHDLKKIKRLMDDREVISTADEIIKYYNMLVKMELNRLWDMEEEND